MTRVEANALRLDNHVRIAGSPGNIGTVTGYSENTVTVRWPSGSRVTYWKDTMPHIEPAPEATRDA